MECSSRQHKNKLGTPSSNSIFPTKTLIFQKHIQYVNYFYFPSIFLSQNSKITNSDNFICFQSENFWSQNSDNIHKIYCTPSFLATFSHVSNPHYLSHTVSVKWCPAGPWLAHLATDKGKISSPHTAYTPCLGWLCFWEPIETNNGQCTSHVTCIWGYLYAVLCCSYVAYI